MSIPNSVFSRLLASIPQNQPMAELQQLGISKGAASLSTIEPPSGSAVEPQRPIVSVLRPESRFLEPGCSQILRSGGEKRLTNPSAPYRGEYVARIDFPYRWSGVLVCWREDRRTLRLRLHTPLRARARRREDANDRVPTSPRASWPTGCEPTQPARPE